MRWISLLLLLLPLAAPAARNEKTISLVVDDAPVAHVLQALAEMNHKNLVVAPDVSGTLSLHLQTVPWTQALRAVADSAGLSLQQQGRSSTRIPRPGKRRIRRSVKRNRRNACRTCPCRPRT